jgi:hypothetical protein
MASRDSEYRRAAETWTPALVAISVNVTARHTLLGGQCARSVHQAGRVGVWVLPTA